MHEQPTALENFDEPLNRRLPLIGHEHLTAHRRRKQNNLFDVDRAMRRPPGLTKTIAQRARRVSYTHAAKIRNHRRGAAMPDIALRNVAHRARRCA